MADFWYAVVPLGILAAIVGRVVLRIVLAGQRAEELTLPNGRTYTYLIGDYMRSYGSRGTFHGIDVSLPKEMPHIYLDSLRGGGRRLQYVIDPSQQIVLEGNFNKDYQVYVPQKYEALALSILTPDVMAVLQDHATAFDVEIYGSHVRVITNRRALPRPKLQAAALQVATKIMEEVDHRLQSWSKADSLNAVHTELLVYPERGLRLFGRSFSLQFLAWLMYWLLITGTFGLAGWIAYYHTDLKFLGIGLMALFVALFVVFTLMTRKGAKKTRFGSRH